MTTTTNKLICGIVMPISAIDGCTESHWTDVQDILTDSIENAGFEANLVSNADDVGIIHKRIIQNLYENPVVVCDVSGRNPNVMFELGMRLAFDKPTVIVKDEKTSYSFDTSVIEHIEYPRDLRFSRVVEFKAKLAEKIKATHEAASKNSGYTTFLKNFGEFTVAKIDKKEVPGQEFILEELKSMRSVMRRLELSASPNRDLRDSIAQRMRAGLNREKTIDICLKTWATERIEELQVKAQNLKGVAEFRIRDTGTHKHFIAEVRSGFEIEDIESALTTSPARFKRLIKDSESA